MIFVGGGGGCRVKDVRDFYLFQVLKNGEVHRLHALMSLDAFVLTDGRTEWWCYANGMLGRGIDQQRDIRMRSKRKVLSPVFVGFVAAKMIGGR